MERHWLEIRIVTANRMAIVRYMIRENLWLAYCVFFTAFPCAKAAADDIRSWTDVDGRVIEAKMLGLKVDKVRVLFNGKEVSIPLARLSEADREYAEEWVPGDEVSGDDPAPDEGGAEKKPPMAAGSSTFDGRELVTGGKINLYEYDYPEGYAAKLRKKYKSEDTGYRLAVAVPSGFDPSLPQKVFIAMAAGNNAEEVKAGNTAALNGFAGKGIEAGWVCVAYDSNLGASVQHNGAYERAIEKLKEVWPGFAGWTVSTGGISGGAKAAQTNACLLVSKEIPVRGVFLAGCNSAGNMTWARDAYGVSKSGVREIRVLMSTGKSDNLVSRGHVESVIKTLRNEGVKKVRDESFEGGHELNSEQFAVALEWFGQDDP